MSWCVETLGIPLTESKGLSSTLGKQFFILSFLHQTQQLAQCSQAGNVLLAFTKPRLISQTARYRNVILSSQQPCYELIFCNGGMLLKYHT